MSNDNIVVSDTKSVTIFHDWDEVPKKYKTRNAWEFLYRKVPKGERPAAVLVLKLVRGFDSFEKEFIVEKRINFYSRDKTRSMKKTELSEARRDFYRLFIMNSDRTRCIRWTEGDWGEDQNGRKKWDETNEKEGWLVYKQRLTFADSIDQTKGNEIFGIFGAKKSRYLLIDLDLHNEPLHLFLRRLEILVNHFHGQDGCHFQVSNQQAGGIHIVLVFPRLLPLTTRFRWITNQLKDLDQAHPACEFMKNGKLNIEVFPCSKPHRLPLARNRTMLLSKPMPLVRRGKKDVQDVVGYMSWMSDPQRSYMSKEDVLWFIMERLDLSCSAFAEDQSNRKTESSKIEINPTSEKPTIKFKGRTRGAIVGYWLNGESEHFKHLNSAIWTTMQALQAEGLTQDDAVNIIKQYVDVLPNSFSSRLADDRDSIDQDIERAATKVWLTNPNTKWTLSNQAWSKIGFHVSDKNTWLIRNPNLEVVVDCEDVQFDDDELRLLVTEMTPLLVGVKQAKKIEKQNEVVRAVAYFLRYVRCCDREIPVNALPKILAEFAINLRRDEKQSKFLKLLTKWKWIYKRTEYYQPKIHGGTGRGRARSYGIGKAMVSKFASLSSNTGGRENGSILLSSTFYEDAEIERIIVPF